MKLDWKHWAYSAGQAVIGGAASAGSAWCGTAIGHAVSDKIPVMDWHALGAVLLSATATNLFFFLKQSPLPKELDSQTK